MGALEILKWLGTAAQLVGVFSLAGRWLQPRVCYVIMLLGSGTWAVMALQAQDWPLLALQGAFCLSNVLGLVRWRAP